VFGSAETPRNHDARTIGGHVVRHHAHVFRNLGRDRVRSPISNTSGAGAIAPVAATAKVGAAVGRIAGAKSYPATLPSARETRP